jgi:hypothetical protein
MRLFGTQNQWWSVPLFAAVASSLLFASVAMGTGASLFIFALSPLPLLLAGFSLHSMAALAAGLLASALLGLGFGAPTLGLTYFIATGAPAWALCFAGRWFQMKQIQLGMRLDSPLIQGGGHVLFALALMASAVTAMGLFSLGSDVSDVFGELAQEVRPWVEEAQKAGAFAAFGDKLSLDELSLLISRFMPAGSAMMFVGLMATNVVAAGQILGAAKVRPAFWPNWHNLTLPRAALVLYAIAVLGNFMSLPPLSFLICSLLTASLGMAFMLQGMAVLHALTVGMSARHYLLAMLYFALTIFAGGLFLLILVAIADVLFDFRRLRPSTLNPLK